jgi:hypothetical protein
MVREAIGGHLAGIGCFFAIAAGIFLIVALQTDRPWYYQSGFSTVEEFTWNGRSLYFQSGTNGAITFVRYDTWEMLGFTSLPALYSVTYDLLVAAIVLAFVTAVTFLVVGYFRWLYRYQTVHLLAEGSSSPPGQAQEFLVEPTYARCRSWPMIRYFTHRRRHGWGLLVTEGLALLSSLVVLALLLAAIATFAAEHPAHFRADLLHLSPLACISPGPCFSLIGDDGPNIKDSQSLTRSWRLGPGWALATATLCLTTGCLVVAIAQIVVRNNRFSYQDESIRRDDAARAEKHGFYCSDRELLLQSSIWQGQEKAYSPDNEWLVADGPFASKKGTAPDMLHQLGRDHDDSGEV